jgi:RNA polymerase sigma factor (sigma-70 family)
LRNRHLKKKTDQQLILLYKESGNTGYVGELFQRYSHLITALSLNYLKNEAETEDAVMEIFEILVKDLKTHEVKNFNAWLYSVTKNHCLKKKKNKEMLVDDNDGVFEKHSLELADNENEQEYRRIKEERLEFLSQAIESLKGEQKECIRLFYIEEKSYKEIVEITGYTEKNVKSYIQNGKRKLKIYFNTDE